MNFLAHMLSASRSRASSASSLGAALPDLSSIAKVSFSYESLPDDVRLGVGLHHQSDAAFHASSLFLNDSKELRNRMSAAGLAEGASRAIGHIGWELLLDGHVLRLTEADRVFRECVQHSSVVKSGLNENDLDDWESFLRSLESEWWLGYRDPNFVAMRLHSILGQKPRLAFSDDQIAVVAEVLAAHSRRIESRALDVISLVVATLQRNVRPCSP